VIPSALFLDFDGVVSRNPPPDDPFRSGIERLVAENVHLLDAIVRRTGCRVVVSSSWRYDPATGLGSRAPVLESWLRAKGYTGRVDGITPHHGEVRWSDDIEERRGGEILAWCVDRPQKPRAIAVLDDMALRGPIAPFLVQTDESAGITAADVERVVALLQQPLRGRRPWTQPRRAVRVARPLHQPPEVP